MLPPIRLQRVGHHLAAEQQHKFYACITSFKLHKTSIVSLSCTIPAPHDLTEETGTKRLSNLTIIVELVRGRTRIQPKQPDSRDYIFSFRINKWQFFKDGDYSKEFNIDATMSKTESVT